MLFLFVAIERSSVNANKTNLFPSATITLLYFLFTGVKKAESRKKWEERKYKFRVFWTRGIDRWAHSLRYISFLSELKPKAFLMVYI